MGDRDQRSQGGSVGIVRVLLLCVCCGLWGGMVGCKQWVEKIKKMVDSSAADKEEPAKRRERRKDDPRMVKLRQEAIQTIQNTVTRPGWTIGKEIKNYEKIASMIAKKKQLPKPTGFDWSAICSGGGTCKVMMGFWDGRDRHEAFWVASAQGKPEPLNCWAMSFMAMIKQAQECFTKELKAQKAKAAANKPSPTQKKPEMPNQPEIWENAKKGLQRP